MLQDSASRLGESPSLPLSPCRQRQTYRTLPCLIEGEGIFGTADVPCSESGPSRVPALRNLSLRAPTPPQFRWHSYSGRRKNAHLFVHHLPLVAKRRAIVPHNHPISPKNPQFRQPRPATLPPCSNPSPIHTILTSTQIQPATQARDSHPNAYFPTPRTSLPQTRSPARQYHPNHHQNPSIGPHSAPRPAPCPTGISGNERK